MKREWGLRPLREIVFIIVMLIWLKAQGTHVSAQARIGVSQKLPRWGRIVNQEHAGQRVLSGLYFAGPPNPHFLPHYTHHPQAGEWNGWMKSDVDYALAQVKQVGLNTLCFSYWGHDGETDRWGTSLLFSRTRWPGDVGTEPYTDAEQVGKAQSFFRQAAAHKLLLAPLLEVSPSNPFWADFPDKLDPLVQRSTFLLTHLGKEPNWLQLRDRTGKPRRVIRLIETIHGSEIDPVRFAAAFDNAAERIRQNTGYAVGFVIDPTPLPAYGSEQGPTALALKTRDSILAIAPFNITSQGVGAAQPQSALTETQRLEYAAAVLQKWSASGIPLLAPILPGYDAHSVFPNLSVYGFNTNWRQRQKELAVKYETAGLSIDCWNGWTEGYAIPPSRETGNAEIRWVADVVATLQAKWKQQAASLRPRSRK